MYKINSGDMSKCCLFCVNSMSADGMDGMPVLVCFECEGKEGREMQVDEDETCANFKGE